MPHLEETFRSAHTFVISGTGVGVVERDVRARFDEIVMKKCPYYYDLLPIMADRSRTQPTLTNLKLEWRRR
jgi:hypothetical protein